MLISGQATVLYGAATFSEDIDLWVEPKVDNWNKFLKVLGEVDARVYKLTPPVKMKYIKKGHGFHFQLRTKAEKPPYCFLDVMGVVPRARDFRSCFKNVTYQNTDWGRLPVVGLRDLVEIKKTRRLEDYAIISNLVRIEYERLSTRRINTSDWRWILNNSFDIDDILYYFETYSVARRVAKYIARPCVVTCLKGMLIEKARDQIALEIEDLRRDDRKYWEPVIKELKTMKEMGQLLTEERRPPNSVLCKG